MYRYIVQVGKDETTFMTKDDAVLFARSNDGLIKIFDNLLNSYITF